MDIRVIEDRRFSILVGGIRLDGMKVHCEWNGMIELRNAADQSLIIDIGNTWRWTEGIEGTQRDAKVIKGSPDLLALLKGAEPKPQVASGTVTINQSFAPDAAQAIRRSMAEAAVKVSAAAARANKRKP